MKKRQRRIVQVPSMVEVNPALTEAVADIISTANTLVIKSQADGFRSFLLKDHKLSADWCYIGDDKKVHFRTDDDWPEVRFVETYRPVRLAFFRPGYSHLAKYCSLLVYWGIFYTSVNELHAAVEERISI